MFGYREYVKPSELLFYKNSGEIKGKNIFKIAADDASRFTAGTLPNGLAFAENGDILISNFNHLTKE
jgi:hypothetical protein